MVCKRYTRAFLHPLAAKGLPFASHLITYHNVAYMMVRQRGLLLCALSDVLLCLVCLWPTGHG